jgi:predicted acyl esterase
VRPSRCPTRDGVRNRHKHLAALVRLGRLAARAAARSDRRSLYLTTGLQLSFASPKPSDTAFDEYVSDPAKLRPFRARPIQPIGYDKGLTWSEWLVDDQRESLRPSDVVVFVSDVLTLPVKISVESQLPIWSPPLVARIPTGSSS